MNAQVHIPNTNPASRKREAAATARRTRGAFTLIELLVVIAVIGLLAGMFLYMSGAIQETKKRKYARGQLEQLITVIESYKENRGYYPPSNNTNDCTRNPLYYELVGSTTNALSGEFVTTDGRSRLTPAKIRQAFGMDGFINSDATADKPQNFHRNLRNDQLFTDADGVMFLAVNLRGPQGEKSLWQYNSASPRYNPGSYDLWVTVTVGSKTETIGNFNTGR